MRILILIMLIAFSPTTWAHNVSPAQGGMMTVIYGGTPGTISVTPDAGEACIVTAQASEVITGNALLSIQNSSPQPGLSVTMSVTAIRQPLNNSETTSVRLTWGATGNTAGGTPDPNCNGSGTVTFSVTVGTNNGACGSANGTVVSTAPPIGAYCSAGTVGTVSTGSATVPWTWTCLGANTGNNAYCSSIINGACGSASSAILSSNPPIDSYCSAGAVGTVSSGSATIPWTWPCLGINGGSNAYCSSLLPGQGPGQNGQNGQAGNGICGPANGVVTAIQPARPALLCAAGAPSVVGGVAPGPWTWACGGVNGGKDAACATVVPVKGVCGPANGVASAIRPAAGLCNSGVLSPLGVGNIGLGPFGPFNWVWTCDGNAPGASANCTAPVLLPAPVNGACGAANGTYVSIAPVAGLCNAGVLAVPPGVVGVGGWTWTCNGIGVGAINANCLANPIPAAVCGSASGAPVPTAPSKNLCTIGAASSVTGTGPWSWTCSVGKFGITANCSTGGRSPRNECLISWAEQKYPQYFSPTGGISMAIPPYTYRYYSDSGNYLAISSADDSVYVLGKDFGNTPVNVGPATNFLGLSGCQ
jgi:hypothetical protein